MFGFLKPSCATRRSNPSAYNRYRQVYAAFCAHHRARHGVLASTLISYEAVFLYQLAIASGACSSPAPTTPTCCRLRSDPTNRWNLDKDLADFCSDFGMLLVRIKLEDDVRDSGSLIAKTTQRLLRKKLKQASSALDKLSKDQNSTTLTEKIDDLVQSHIAFENPGSPNSSSPVEIQQYAQPTADAFRLIFECFGNICESRGGVASEFGAIGEEVGRSILIGDCCFDFEKDLFKREFNPICNRDEIPAAINAALRSLSRLGWLCDEMGRTNSQTSALPTALPAACLPRYQPRYQPSCDLHLRKSPRCETAPHQHLSSNQNFENRMHFDTLVAPVFVTDATAEAATVAVAMDAIAEAEPRTSVEMGIAAESTLATAARRWTAFAGAVTQALKNASLVTIMIAKSMSEILTLVSCRPVSLLDRSIQLAL